MTMRNPWIVVGAVSGFLAVAIGAFGAHGLKAILSPEALTVYHTGAQYQMYHALALVGLGIWAAQNPSLNPSLPGWAFTAGILLFSGSLYALALTDIKLLGAITPFGGLSFMFGWLCLAWLAARHG
jgi:uncharacterized membrane protein YgdD (TMEM256/DUF423 family)